MKPGLFLQRLAVAGWVSVAWMRSDPRQFLRLLRQLAVAIRMTAWTVVERHMARFVLDAIHDVIRDSDASVVDLAVRSAIRTEEQCASVLSACSRVREMFSLRPEDVALLDRVEAAVRVQEVN